MLGLSRVIGVVYLLITLLIVGLTAVFGPLPMSNAPFPLIPAPSREPIVLSLVYGSEKEVWLKEAVARFEASNQTVRGRPIQITLDNAGSRQIAAEILSGRLQPVVFSPASSLQLDMVRNEWQKQHGNDLFLSGQDAPISLLSTPLVVVAWEERAQVLWTDTTTDLWHRIQEVLSDPQGWGKFERPDWGFAKFGHTSPETSNSGLQTLVLLAYSYHHKTSNLTVRDVQDPGFQTWLDGIETNVSEFGDSTGAFMQNMVNFGPGKYDFVAVYENLALQNAEAAKGRWRQPIHISYPPGTLMSDHPYAILNADWVTDEQKEGAALFRDFLLSDDIQKLALSAGFRPANKNISLTSDDPSNPFHAYQDYGVQVENLPPEVGTPSAEVLNALIDLWVQKGYSR